MKDVIPKKVKKRLALLRRATRVMGGDCVYSSDWFVHTAIQWLADNLGDVHVAYLEHEGWEVSCCYIEDSWRNCKRHKRLDVALAKAVCPFEKGI